MVFSFYIIIKGFKRGENILKKYIDNKTYKIIFYILYLYII